MTGLSSVFAFLLVAVCLLQDVSSQSGRQGRQEFDTELFITSTTSCEAIIEDQRFEGSCCSLNSTSAGGCILNVVNGNCKTNGGVWSLEYISTYDTDGAQCPPSEFTGFVITEFPTQAPGGDGSPAPVVHAPTGVLGLSVLIAAMVVPFM